MRAVICNEFGDPSVLHMGELPSVAPGPGEIRIEIHAAGVNFADCLMIRGEYYTRPDFPFSPGIEAAGVIAECGDGVTGFATGDRVMILPRYQGHAEEVTRPTTHVYKVPEAMSMTVAGAFPMVYFSAYGALVWKGGLKAGESVVVHGAGGGVGIAGVEIAKAMGATVIATAGSPAKLEIAKAHGADHLIDYETENVRDRIREAPGGAGADVILDLVGGKVFAASLRAMAMGARILIVGWASGPPAEILGNYLLPRDASAHGFRVYSFLDHQEGADHQKSAGQIALDRMMGWMAAGTINPLISKTYPLEDATAAFQSLLDRTATGKVVLTTGRS